jgi:hypothetical protein
MNTFIRAQKEAKGTKKFRLSSSNHTITMVISKNKILTYIDITFSFYVFYLVFPFYSRSLL